MESNAFKPIRLKEARELRGYTMVDLANTLGVTRQAISQYENGSTKPSMSNLIRLSNFLNIPLYYFLRERPRYSIKTSPLFFRKFNSSTKKHRIQAERYEEWLTDIIEYLDGYLNFPPTNLLHIDSDFTKLKPQHIEDIASGLRKFWKLGEYPISNITMLLENNGIVLGHKKLDGKLDSFSCWHNNRSYILLTNNNRTAVRSRFNAMHEIGHLILHKDVTEEELEDRDLHKRIEDQANRFASAFLMPASTFASDFISISTEALLYLKRRWLVSMKAIATRAYDLGFITESQKVGVFKRLAPYRNQEPLDKEIPIERPVLLSRGIEVLIADGVLTKTKLLRELNIPNMDLIELACLESNYFDLGSDENIIDLNFKESIPHS